MSINEIVNALESGETVSYEDIDALGHDEQAALSRRVLMVEEQGDGYRLATVIREQIEALKDEAQLHGDYEQVDICQRALVGHLSDVLECERAIGQAAASQD